MRKLMWFAWGFGAACAFCANFYVSWVLPAALICLMISGLTILLTRWVKRFRVLCAVFLGAAVGFAWFFIYDTQYLGNPRQLDGNKYSVTIDVADYSYETKYGSAFDGTMTLDGYKYSVRVYLDDNHNLEPGDQVHGVFSFRLTTNGGYKEPSYHQGNGIFLIAQQKGNSDIVRSGSLDWSDYPAIWRAKLTGIIEKAMPGDVSGFAKALLLGDRTGIDYETDTAFKISGISHVIAVSGLHVSILFAVIYFLTGKRRFLTALVGVPMVIAFAAVAGFSPSITRASIMQILLMLSMLIGKEYDPFTSLGTAALIMMLINPLVITSVSFQMSFGCMAGIFLFGERIRCWIMDSSRLGRWKGRLYNWFASSVSITLSATVFTTPLAAIYFGTVSLVGVLTNLLTLWVITYVFYGVMIVCLLGFISLPAASAVGWLIGWPIRFVLGCAKLLSAVPLAAVYTKSIYIVIWLLFAYVLLFIYLHLKEKPAALFAGLMISGLCLCVAASWIEPLLFDCRMTVLDVGQGQSIILQSGGKTFLVDCGGDYDENAADIAAENLLSQGISRLDGIVLTHLDSDHAGGIPYLLKRIKTDAIYYPRMDDRDAKEDVLAGIAEDQLVCVGADMVLRYDTTVLTVFAPESYNSGNESSICILFQTEKCDILITGDRGTITERILLKEHSLPQLDVLVVGHHGSKYSTGEELLAATKPEYAFISVGENNPYGHPAQEVLDRLQSFGCTVFRTDQNGTIVFRR